MNPTRRQVEAALRFLACEPPTPPRMSCTWRIHWLAIEPTVRRYQEAVPLSRVLAEHHGAIAAEPLSSRPAAEPKRPAPTAPARLAGHPTSKPSGTAAGRSPASLENCNHDTN